MTKAINRKFGPVEKPDCVLTDRRLEAPCVADRHTKRRFQLSGTLAHIYLEAEIEHGSW